MIRLKPSELTLTPADLDETRRRMEQKHITAAAATLPPAIRARLRRGPVRARDDSITSLGHVPILRPQQAVHASAEGPEGPPRLIRDSLNQSSEAASNELTYSPALGEQDTLGPPSTSRSLAGPPPVAEVCLTFRPTPDYRDPSPAVSQEDTNDDTRSAPKIHQGSSRLGRSGTNSPERGIDGLQLTRHHVSTDGQIDPATSSDSFELDQAPWVRRRSSHVPAPLLRVQSIISRLDQGIMGRGSNSTEQIAGTELATVEASSSARFTRGHWDSRQRYSFREFAPQTEPRPRTGQSFTRNRTMSSSSEPPYKPRIIRPDTSESSNAGDVFWNTPAPEPPSVHISNDPQNGNGPSTDRYWSPLRTDGMVYGDSMRNRPDRQSSGTSVSSQPYSLYELPESSRHSSSIHSQSETLAQSQYDGAGPPHQVRREASRGAYYSIRLPQNRGQNEAFIRPTSSSPCSSTSSPDLTVLGPHGPSPLPSKPYSRISSAQHRLIPSTGLIDTTDFVGDGHDAARAVERDLSSPLELIQERANAYFDRISARMQAVPSHAHMTDSRAPARVAEGVASFSRTAARDSRFSGTASLLHGPDNSGHNRTGAQSGGQIEGYAPVPAPGPVEEPNVQVANPQGPRRISPAVRAIQRSSENVPVGLSTQDTRLLRLPVQRASFVLPPSRTGLSVAIRGGELFNATVTARFGDPQGQRPRGLFNHPQMHSPYPELPPSDEDPSESDASDIILSATSHLLLPSHQNPIRGPHIPPRHASRQDVSSEVPYRQLTRRTVTPIPAPLPFSRRSERGLPSTSTTLDSASGVTSRRTQVARAATRRQVMQGQRNSEQSGTPYRRDVLPVVERDVGMTGRSHVMKQISPRTGEHERLDLD